MAEACYQQWHVNFAAQPHTITLRKAVSLMCKVISTKSVQLMKKSIGYKNFYNNFKGKELDKVINKNHRVHQ